jgi:hypothetical protein
MKSCEKAEQSRAVQSRAVQSIQHSILYLMSCSVLRLSAPLIFIAMTWQAFQGKNIALRTLTLLKLSSLRWLYRATYRPAPFHLAFTYHDGKDKLKSKI